MDSDLAQPDETANAPRLTHREDRRGLIVDRCGHAYAAVIERAAELHVRLGALVSVAFNQAEYERTTAMCCMAAQNTTDSDTAATEDARARAANRYRDALTLDALREAAMLILQAPPLNRKAPATSHLVSLHLWRMAAAIRQDSYPDVTGQQA